MFFFGCRSESKDYFYRSEWETYTSEGFLHMYTAFSRDQSNKRYVQHCMLEHSQQLVRLLEHQEAVFYVSGYEHARQRASPISRSTLTNTNIVRVLMSRARSAGQMPKDVREALVQCFTTEWQQRRESHRTPDDAEAFVRQLEKSARYVTETWQ